MPVSNRPNPANATTPPVLPDSLHHEWGWRPFLLALLIPVIFSAIAWASAGINYLVFHVTVELFSVVIAITALIVALTSKQFTQNHFVVFLSIAIGWCGAIDMLHTMAYKGMNLLPVNESNFAPQLWIIARFVQALALLIATYFLRHALKAGYTIVGFGLLSLLLVALAASGHFPDAFIESQGQTPFKIGMEFVIILIMIVALWTYWIHRALMSQALFINMVLAVVSLILAEFAFTQYADLYAKSNMVGHIFKIFGYWFIYQALVHNTLKEPFSMLSRAASSFDAVPEPTVVLTKDGVIQQINNAAAAISRVSKETVIGADIHTVMHDSNASKDLCMVCQRMAQGETAFRQAIQLSDGRTLHCTVSPFAGEQFEDQLVQVIEDVTYETALSRERDQLLFNLNERIKELECLNRISKLSERTDLDPKDYVQAVKELLPRAFRFAEKIRISVQLQHYGFEHDPVDFSQHACIKRPIVVQHHNVGELIVYYPIELGQASDLFLTEEYGLMDTVAQSVGEDISKIEAVHRSGQLHFLYETLSATNRAMLRAQSQDELIIEFFDVLKFSGAFPVLFVANVETTGSDIHLRLVHTHGVRDDLRQAFQLALNDPNGSIIERIAHLKQGVVDVSELAEIKGPSEWVQYLLHLEISVRVMVPLFVNQQLVSIVGLYGKHLEQFDAEQLRLLNQLSSDVSFALNHLNASERIWKSEQALIESEAHFRKMIEQSSAGMYVRRKDRLIYVNPRFCEIVGYGKEELLHQSIYRFINNAPASVERIHQAWEQLDSGAPSVTYTASFKCKDGQELELELHAKAIDWDGEQAHIVLVTDVTELIRQRDKINAYVQQLESMMRATLDAVANMVEMRDPYTAGHERRVGVLASEIARELGWSEERCQSMELVGLVHDIGKIAVPAEILTKPTKLTELEMQLIRIHPQVGYDILKQVPFPIPVAEIIHQHHERMDGSGYPLGLKADEILPESRVLAVADVIESMATHRPYRPARGLEAALTEIESHAGTLFDPEVCEAALRLFREKSYQLPA